MTEFLTVHDDVDTIWAINVADIRRVRVIQNATVPTVTEEVRIHVSDRVIRVTEPDEIDMVGDLIFAHRIQSRTEITTEQNENESPP